MFWRNLRQLIWFQTGQSIRLTVCWELIQFKSWFHHDLNRFSERFNQFCSEKSNANIEREKFETKMSKWQNIDRKISKWQNMERKRSKWQNIDRKISKWQNMERKRSKWQNIERQNRTPRYGLTSINPDGVWRVTRPLPVCYTSFVTFADFFEFYCLLR